MNTRRVALIAAVCAFFLCPSAVKAQGNPSERSADREKASEEQLVELELKYSSITNKVTDTLKIPKGVTTFACVIDTKIDENNQPPDFLKAYVMGSAPGDKGATILPNVVELSISTSNTYVFVFVFTSTFESKELAGVAKFKRGAIQYVAPLKGVRIP